MAQNPKLSITEKYGYKFAQPISDCAVELMGFRESWQPTGKYRHFLAASAIVYPDMIWHEWAREQIKSLCQTDNAIQMENTIHRYVYWIGCGTSGKTFSAGHYAFLWWMSDPGNSIVILTSTTKGMVERRIWPVIQDMYHNCRRNLAARYDLDVSAIDAGHLIDSRLVLQASKTDKKHAIFAIAVKEGETSKAVANIQGQHAKRILIVIDEATDTPEGIFQAVPNLKKACQDLTVLVIGNPISRLIDPFGKACEPKSGWNSVTKDSVEWVTKGVKDLCLESGICKHFQGSKSPNVRAGKTVYPFLYTWEDYQMARAGENYKSLHYWKWDEGFPPPSGVCNTIFSEEMILRNDGRGKFTFHSKSEPIACLDPAFGGDKCIIRFALMGDLQNGKMAVQLTDTVEIIMLAESTDELEVQICKQLIAECAKRNVRTECCGILATGTGRGVYAFARTDWGECIRIEEGGSPSDKPASIDDPRPSNEVYDRRVTELWYSAKEFLIAGQLKGLSDAEIIQFCSRQYTVKARKYSIETKSEFKEHLGHSPDEGDAAAGVIEVARQRGASPFKSLAEPAETENKLIEAVNAVYDEDTRFNAQFAESEDSDSELSTIW